MGHVNIAFVEEHGLGADNYGGITVTLDDEKTEQVFNTGNAAQDLQDAQDYSLRQDGNFRWSSSLDFFPTYNPGYQWAEDVLGNEVYVRVGDPTPQPSQATLLRTLRDSTILIAALIDGIEKPLELLGDLPLQDEQGDLANAVHRMILRLGLLVENPAQIITD